MTKPTPQSAIDTLVHDTLTIVQRMKDLPQMDDGSFDAYETICQKMPSHVRSGRLKIAVVGVIKSGKSTFVNALVGKELVKRGAGVVTSMTTRIRKGRKNQATLYVKSWDEINFQLQKALLSFPDDRSAHAPNDGFDIRRRKDRQYLKTVYQRLVADFSVSTEAVRPETLLIGNALDGFDACSSLVQADETVVQFESKNFDTHKAYTSDPGRAFYIKDVCLEVFGRAIDPNIEIADCQGADSTDPAQLAKVLAYLESSNLIVYCISSRIGLRQSDLIFLKRIKDLGLLGNIFFINNCDLTEHENLEDLLKIQTHVRDNLKFLEIHPRLFSFSCLYALFSKRESKLKKKELARLRLWQAEKKMLDYCEGQAMEFEQAFQQAIDKNRYELLISNHLKRLAIILSDLDGRTRLFLDLLSSDKLREDAAIQTLDRLHDNAYRLESIVANSLDGAVSGLRHEIETNIINQAATDQAAILKNTRQYIRALSMDVDRYRFTAKETGFNQILYFMFQDFKRSLDLYVIEQVNPLLKEFVKTQETRITDYFQSLFDSYQIDLFKADHCSQFEAVSPPGLFQNEDVDSVNVEKIKKILGLQLPEGIFEAKYTPAIKASVFTDFGLKTLFQLACSVLGRKSSFSFSPGLEKAAMKIKTENQKGLQDQFERFHARLRTDYFEPLIEAATRDFKEKIKNRFNRYQSCKKKTEDLFSLKLSEKKDQKNRAEQIHELIQTASEDTKKAIETSWKTCQKKE